METGMMATFTPISSSFSTIVVIPLSMSCSWPKPSTTTRPLPVGNVPEIAKALDLVEGVLNESAVETSHTLPVRPLA